jgi:trehalose 6-phosphate phosphatase
VPPDTAPAEPSPLDPPPPWVVLDRLPPALFLDVDGTLLEFADHPSDVRASTGLISLLQAAQDCLGGALAVISGRSVADLDRVFDPWRPWAAGVHGVEVRGPQGLRRHDPDPRAVARLRRRAAELSAALPGVWVEDKGVGVTLHHRAVPEADEQVRRAAATLAAELDGAYEVQPGVFTQELRPAGWDKGRAVVELMASAPFAGRVPVVVGDDRTDEDAFGAARRLGGTAVLVGDRPDTVATHRLADPAAVRAWLAELVEGAGR